MLPTVKIKCKDCPKKDNCSIWQSRQRRLIKATKDEKPKQNHAERA